MRRQPWVWQGIEIWHSAQFEEVLALVETEEEAGDFLAAYTEVCDDEDHAIHNVEYFLNLIDKEIAGPVAELFMVELGRTLSPRQLFANSSLGVKA